MLYGQLIIDDSTLIRYNNNIKEVIILNFDEFSKKYNISLNSQQRAAAEKITGPCLLLAVPGSGKTTVLVTRLGYMIYGCNIDPSQILTLTYTVAATHDMKNRFIRLFGDDAGLEFRTINGICAKVLEYFSRKIGREAFDLETDEKNRAKRISGIYQAKTSLFPAESDVKDISTRITYIKNMMLEEKDIKKMESDVDYPLYEIYKAYNESMRADKLIDYDDQMIYAYKILTSNPETLEYFSNKYRYICVDEAQDTSKIQHMLIKLIAGNNDNLFMVGDEDQSIYGFRAAYPAALLSFEKDHPGAEVLLMEENFRSNKNIVDAADCFIQKNTIRHKKTLKAFRPAGSTIKKLQVNGRSGQYDYLCTMAENCTEETAVLYKDNESIIPLIDLLDRKNIPFRIRNAELSFFTHRTVVDIINIILFAMNPYRADLFMNIYYKLSLYMTKKEADAIVNRASVEGIDILRAGLRHNFTNDNVKYNFVSFVNDCRTLVKKSPDSAVNYICNVMDYDKYLTKNHISDGKLYILKNIWSRCRDIREALSRLNELSVIIKETTSDPSCKLIFSTIHSSKGLEYKNVYIIDAIDGIFPESGKLTKEDFEELRRIFYVGITRAKDNLFLFRTGESSRFIDELSTKKASQSGSLMPSYDDYLSNLVPGQTVQHTKFGKGKVKSVKIPFVTITFSDKEKTFGIMGLYEKNLLTFQN